MAPSTPIPSATVLILRDGKAGIEVLMVERAQAIEFAGGALAFPGGKVTAGDHDRRLARHITSMRRRDRRLLARRIAAVREAFEETGILIARDRRSGRVPGERRRAQLARHWRPALSQNKAELYAMLHRHHLVVDPTALVPFAHWITPPVSPIRFDTTFFLAEAPHGQLANHDGWEAVHAHWITPANALEADRKGQLRLMFPTRLNLARLGRSKTIAEATTAARRQPVVTVEPEIFQEDGNLRARIPTNAGYGDQGVYDRVP